LPGDVMTAIGIDLERHGRISQEDYGWGSVLPSGTAQPDLPLAEVYGPAVILTNHREVPSRKEGWSSTPTRPQTLAQLIRATRWQNAIETAARQALSQRFQGQQAFWHSRWQMDHAAVLINAGAKPRSLPR